MPALCTIDSSTTESRVNAVADSCALWLPGLMVTSRVKNVLTDPSLALVVEPDPKEKRGGRYAVKGLTSSLYTLALKNKSWQNCGSSSFHGFFFRACA